MDREDIIKLIELFERRDIGKDEFLQRLLGLTGYSDLFYAKVDTSRLERTGFPEVVYCRNKTDEELIEISKELYNKNGFALLTKADKRQYSIIASKLRDTVFHDRSGVIVVGKGMKKKGMVSVLSGGTSDIPVAEEAGITAEVFGCNVQMIYDVGVAGIHRLFSVREKISKSNAIVVVAGMEGALPSVVSGLLGIPVIGVPTSVGYGINLGGITPLLTMLNSCAPGVSVVNIDNGFGAGYIASLINRKVEEARKR
ncbi:MAG: nickel pincer cofactor biosynthesis protein LarB [Spirochaetota bacterium]